ncbi:tRNA dihydrouridine synthase DusB [Alginatibacterium sediminis]|uniref:tRNA-dihydrouridine synthase B n=1 Tax=Alginatibacterium sediminis TaxID=2164068 RepID=A0A420E8F5_9ALTE|nr:tRNA dihydrouridine synthase DusB [Alginatibacterium sediminis]RKF14463.1 tRNA dihydrouridine synthase DusB [Alginatibacterium sediminis]
MQIGPYKLENPVILAPMAGVTDQPFRQLCWKLGAGLTVSEMLSSNPKVWTSQKSLQRMTHLGECGIRSVQIAGSCPDEMAHAAQVNASNGAQIIDINMGCPAKKVNKKLAGSALMKSPDLVRQILKAVVGAVEIPVTLKIRTGWCEEQKNALEIAQIAEDCGIDALAIHGRTRTCMYRGHAEYDTIAAVKQQVSMPVVANGDITSPEQAKYVLDYTGTDAVMVGRGAQGNPWIFREINHYLRHGEHIAGPTKVEIQDVMLGHLNNLYQFYGELQGLRIARKHVGWYLKRWQHAEEFRQRFNRLESCDEQTSSIERFFQ